MIESRLDGGVAAPEELGERGEPAIRIAAWCVHFYTAIGLILAAWIAVLLVRGGADAFRWSFVLMLVASLVDATDGTLARKVRVKEVLPDFDGRKLDDIIDFLTYTCLPLLLIWRAGLFPEGYEPWLLLPLLASAYGFCQVEVKTDDGYFLGFPSLWNVVAFYLYTLQMPGWLAILWRTPTIGPPPVGDSTWWLAAVSLYFPVFYMAASWAVTIQHWRARGDRDRG